MVTSTTVRQVTKKRSGDASAEAAKARQRSREDAASAPSGNPRKAVVKDWVVMTSGSMSKELAKAPTAKAAYKAAAQSRSQDSSVEARRISASSRAQVIALMKSAGILSAAGKLTRSFK